MAPFAVIALAALGLRLWELDGRTMHYDESLHVHYAWKLAIGEGYVHSPWMHGPFQVHIVALMFKLFSDSDLTARLAYALFGSGLVALPFFLRTYLGRTGAIVTAVLLALSPSLLYFSRFGRNEILMAFWAVALLVLMWRYLNGEKDRYLYMAAAVLALAFATKETAYIIVGIFGAALFLMSLPDIVAVALGRSRLSDLKGAPVFLILLVTLTLPQWSALAGLLQGALGVVMVNDEQGLDVGFPVGSGWFWSLGIIGVILVATTAFGMIWRWRVWLICAGIFYGIWVTFYTTAFTRCGGVFTSIVHPSRFVEEFPSELGSCVDGLYTGIWQGLGYWMAQQEVARGGQPWYYHFVLGSVYEFLPLLFGTAAIVYYLKRLDLFGLMLGFWAIATLAAYTVAGEKMPWLIANVTVPFILLAGKLIGDLIDGVMWRRVLRTAQAALLILPPLLLLAGVYLLQRYLDHGKLDSWTSYVLLASVIVIAVGIGLLVRAGRARVGMSLAGIGVGALLLGFSTFVAFRASYSYDDTPVEMLSYAQGSSDIVRMVNTLEEGVLGDAERERLVDVDYELWYPFNWYVRHEQKEGALQFKCYKDEKEDGYVSWCKPLEEPPSTRAILLIESHANRDSTQLKEYEKSGPFKNLLWFPEGYRRPGEDRKLEGLGTELKEDLKFAKDNITRREPWRDALAYFLHRRLGTQWWNSNFYAYTSAGAADQAEGQ